MIAITRMLQKAQFVRTVLMTEETLSDKIDTRTNWKDKSKDFILAKDVKNFIEKLKEYEFSKTMGGSITDQVLISFDEIDKLAGDALINSPDGFGLTAKKVTDARDTPEVAHQENNASGTTDNEGCTNLCANCGHKETEHMDAPLDNNCFHYEDNDWCKCKKFKLETTGNRNSQNKLEGGNENGKKTRRN